MSSVDPDVEARWLRTRPAVQDAVGEATVVEGRIPGWEPTSLEETLDWLRVHVYEGFYVAFLAVPREKGLTLWVKEWECGEDEPPWAAILDPAGTRVPINPGPSVKRSSVSSLGTPRDARV